MNWKRNWRRLAEEKLPPSAAATKLWTGINVGIEWKKLTVLTFMVRDAAANAIAAIENFMTIKR